MTLAAPYAVQQPTREAIDALQGPAVLEFGTDWCGFCRAAQPHIDAALSGHQRITHLKVEDGPGRPLGRSFKVKLWPTLIFLRAGVEVARVVRPQAAAPIRDALEKIEAADS